MSDALPRNEDHQRGEMARALARGGFGDVHVVSRETATEVLTPRRVELLDTLKERGEAIGSVRQLAAAVGRDKGAVSRDLARLAEYGLIEYVDEGASRRPQLTYETIVVEPIV